MLIINQRRSNLVPNASVQINHKTCHADTLSNLLLDRIKDRVPDSPFELYTAGVPGCVYHQSFYKLIGK